ncbi:MAG TPA: hypothetical protein VM910_40385 [Bradyrhizobium sp.]|nr:hypothetical protein [Bradyrhizobium sp.]
MARAVAKAAHAPRPGIPVLYVGVCHGPGTRAPPTSGNIDYFQGYKRAGDILIQNALADLYDRDSLIFPAIFNYRHLLSCI